MPHHPGELTGSWQTLLDDEAVCFISWATTALVVYEYCITFEMELQHIWGRKFTGTTVLFFLNRYLPFAIRLVDLLSMLPWPDSSLQTYRVWRLAAKANIGTGLAQLLLRDGTVYFVALVVFNGAAIICSQEMGGNALLDLVSTMSSILMSRFILNLREVYQSNLHEHIDIIQISTVQYSSMHFTSSTKCSVIGTMGAPVGDDDFLQDRKLDDEWEGDPEQAPPLFSEDPLMSGLRDDAWVQLDDRWSRGSCYQPQV
ncbi:hypothetical protein OBBRIDRAFT_837966 [Obba rivulosa]|uniref:DUF6533 domain-containing protein n=1 Tax=Obba rivulosa TaxID=1052685 RepID=A0A8E2AM37_9APHY|nr:hypothetical protein OBBRIDRAFT_837966 [Obba rivulosa]